MIWDFIKNSIPWWVYLIGIVAAGAVLWVYFGPVILAIWRILPNWAKFVIGLLLAVGLSVVYGRNKGFSDAKEAQRRLDERAVQKRREIHDDVANTPDSKLDERMSKWLRE